METICTPLIQRRLDFFLISNNLQGIVKKANILSAIATDHSAIKLDLCSVNNISGGPSHWPFNTSLLENEDYVSEIKEQIPRWRLESSDSENPAKV